MEVEDKISDNKNDEDNKATESEVVEQKVYNTSVGLPTIKSALINDEEHKEGFIPTINISSEGSEDVQYRVYLYLPDKKVWEDVTGGYTEKFKPSEVASIKLNRGLHEGRNSFSVWVKRNGQEPANKSGGYDNFVSYVIEAEPLGNIKTPKITSVDIDKEETSVGAKPTVSLKSDSDVNVEYKVFLYSQTKRVWDDVSNGYTESSDPNVEKNIKLTKELQPGRNTLSIYVKKAGYTASNSAGYDTYVHEVVEVDQNEEDIAKILTTTVDSSKIVLGMKPEITVSGASGDKSNISYKALFYSNDQQKWIDATNYTSGIASGSSTKLSLNTPLEAGSNKILIWAKRSSILGEVYESFKEVTIDAVKPAPLKKKIVVDPGHGGKDPGAVSSNGTRERDIVLKVGTKLGNLLEADGYDVLYTRTSNDSVAWDSSSQNASLKYRYNYANSNGAELFISIHCNSAGSSASGTETFYSSVKPSKDKEFTTSVHKELVKSIGLKDRGVKSGNFSVINNTKMAATLAELGFVSNASDEAKLKTDAFQQKCAEGLYNGIVRY